MSEPRRLTFLWASTACYRESFIFYPHILLTEVNVKQKYLFIYSLFEDYIIKSKNIASYFEWY
jgi:hypothetical protein